MDPKQRDAWDNGRHHRRTAHDRVELEGHGLEQALRFLAWQHGGMVTAVNAEEFRELRARERGIIRQMRLARDKPRMARLTAEARAAARLARRAGRGHR